MISDRLVLPLAIFIATAVVTFRGAIPCFLCVLLHGAQDTAEPPVRGESIHLNCPLEEALHCSLLFAKRRVFLRVIQDGPTHRLWPTAPRLHVQ